jgi:hypothetical protein
MRNALCLLTIAAILFASMAMTGCAGTTRASVPSPVAQSRPAPYTGDRPLEFYFADEDEDRIPPGELIIVDAVILRPLGLVSMAVGFAGSIVAWPWATTSCSQYRVEQALICEPYNYTFTRPVGEMDY